MEARTVGIEPLLCLINKTEADTALHPQDNRHVTVDDSSKWHAGIEFFLFSPRFCGCDGSFSDAGFFVLEKLVNFESKVFALVKLQNNVFSTHVSS